MTRAEHLAWCKARAFEYIDAGEWQNAYASFSSDMNKHPETKDHIALGLGLQLMMIGDLADARSMRKFIEGFR